MKREKNGPAFGQFPEWLPFLPARGFIRFWRFR